jgi:2-keto-4-pentenoate hydratase
MELNLIDLADEMKAAQDHCLQIHPFSSRLKEFGVVEAYAVAQIIHENRLKEGAAPVGRKIGFTNSEMWSIYNVCEPIWGYVYNKTIIQLTDQSIIKCRIDRFAEPKIEPEIVVHFQTSPATTNKPEEILSCVDWIANGLEIVQSHFTGWIFQAPDTIADAGLHAMLIVGPPVYLKQLGTGVLSDLERFSVELSCDGIVRERGRGSNVLGSPINAVAHLIDILSKQTLAPTIKAGELVTTGTLTSAQPICAGQTWSTKLEGISLPSITAYIEE